MLLVRYTCTGLCVLAVCWSLWLIVGHIQLSSLQQKTRLIAQQSPEEVLDTYEAKPYSWRQTTCFDETYKWRSLYSLHVASKALQLGDLETYSVSLEQASRANQMRLRCQPSNAKAWLDRTLILMQHEGFSEGAGNALLQSIRLSPNEGWLAEWRVPLLIHFVALDNSDKMKAALIQDLNVIERTYGWRQRRLYQKLGVSGKQELLEVIKH
jgi:hypothetical protein